MEGAKSPTDVSLAEFSWILHPLDKVSLDIVALTKPSLNWVRLML